MDHPLAASLAAAGKPTTWWTSPDGSSVLILPYGGRILGLFPPGSDRNFLWTHPSLQSADTAIAFYAGSDWHNSGGDRTWLSPEVDFFFPEYPNLTPYVQPREFDPGNYKLHCDEGRFVLSNEFVSRLSRSRLEPELRITKYLEPAANPLRSQNESFLSRLQFAGYTLRTRLEVLSRSAQSTPISLWSLLQLPHDGELLIPTFSRSSVRTYFGEISADDLSISDHLIRYRMRAAGEHKIGLQPHALIGRAGYRTSSAGESSLVIRNFFVNPSGDYVDVPWGEPDFPGAAVEACNVYGRWGRFSELEYHAPAINGQTRSACEDESQIWAFRGAEEDILRASHLLLSSDA
jgi:uncharacterized protein DUF6786